MLNWKIRSDVFVINSEGRPRARLCAVGVAWRAGNPHADGPELFAAVAAPSSLPARTFAAGGGTVPDRAVSGVGLALACARFFVQLFPANPPGATAFCAAVREGWKLLKELVFFLSCTFLLRVRNLSLSQEIFTRQKALRDTLVGSSQHPSCPPSACCRCLAAASAAPAPGVCAGERRAASERGVKTEKNTGSFGGDKGRGA